MEKGWTNVFNTADEYLISIAKDLLQNNGIENVVINHKDSAYVIWGEFELFVREEDEKQATEVLENLKKG
jgi:hypothetical protein